MKKEINMTFGRKFLAAMVGVILLISHSAPATASDQCRNQNPLWYKCAKDSDCAIVDGVCNWPDAAAVLFQKEVTECNIQAGTSVFCELYDSNRHGTFKAVCQSGTCRAVKQN